MMHAGMRHATTRTVTWDSQACHLMWHASSAPLTQLRRWIQRSVGPESRRGKSTWGNQLGGDQLGRLGGAAIGEQFTSAMENEHLDFTDRGHGKLARLAGQQAVSLEHGLVQAGPVV